MFSFLLVLWLGHVGDKITSEWLAFLHGLTVGRVAMNAAFRFMLDEEEEYEDDELEEVDDELDRGDMISSLVLVFIDLICELACCWLDWNVI